MKNYGFSGFPKGQQRSRQRPPPGKAGQEVLGVAVLLAPRAGRAHPLQAEPPHLAEELYLHTILDVFTSIMMCIYIRGVLDAVHSNNDVHLDQKCF